MTTCEQCSNVDIPYRSATPERWVCRAYKRPKRNRVAPTYYEAAPVFMYCIRVWDLLEQLEIDDCPRFRQRKEPLKFNLPEYGE